MGEGLSFNLKLVVRLVLPGLCVFYILPTAFCLLTAAIVSNNLQTILKYGRSTLK